MAVPSNGAEHGVLRSTSSAPVKNAPPRPALRPASSMRVVALPGSQTSNTPKKLMANAVRITTMNAIKPALWNCIPQPAAPPPALMTLMMVARIQKLTRMPAVVESPSAKSLARDSPACLMRLNSLSESTGRTHGIKFRMMPPRNAKNNSERVPAIPSVLEAPATLSLTSPSFFFSSASFPAPLFTVLPKLSERLLARSPAPSSMPTLTSAGARQMELSQAW